MHFLLTIFLALTVFTSSTYASKWKCTNLDAEDRAIVRGGPPSSRRMNAAKLSNRTPGSSFNAAEYAAKKGTSSGGSTVNHGFDDTMRRSIRGGADPANNSFRHQTPEQAYTEPTANRGSFKYWTDKDLKAYFENKPSSSK